MEDGVRSYKRTSDEQRQALSDILNRPTSQACTPPTQSLPALLKPVSQSLQGLSLPSASFSHCSINFYIGASKGPSTDSDVPIHSKRRRAMIVDDSDSD